MYDVVYGIVFAMRNESTMVNSKKSHIVSLFYIATHDPIIYLFYLTEKKLTPMAECFIHITSRWDRFLPANPLCWTSWNCLWYASIHQNRPEPSPMHVGDQVNILKFLPFLNIFRTQKNRRNGTKRIIPLTISLKIILICSACSHAVLETCLPKEGPSSLVTFTETAWNVTRYFYSNNWTLKTLSENNTSSPCLFHPTCGYYHPIWRRSYPVTIFAWFRILSWATIVSVFLQSFVKIK